jgi:transcriptional regulator with XRE-family HTH domain
LLPVATTTPKNPRATAFAAKLKATLVEHAISRRELARRLAEIDGASFETARTNVHRLLRADHAPTETTRNNIADALGVPRSDFQEAALSGDPFHDGSGARAATDGRAKRRAGAAADVTEDAA